MNKSLIYKFTLSLVFLSLFSCEEILFVDDISDKEVNLIAPTNDAVLFSTGVSFSWDKVENAEKYRLQIAKPNFTSPIQIVVDTLVTKNSFTRQLNIGKYQWRIKAVNSGYETKYKTQTLEILNNDDFENNTVVLVSPNNNLITKTVAQKLSWQSIIGAIEYQVQITDSNNQVIKDGNTSSLNFDYTFTDGDYNWKVRASNGSKQTLYTSRAILVDTKAPNTPVLTSPANASTTTNTEINFQFSRTPITGSVEKDSIYVFKDNALTNLQFKDQVKSPYTKTLTTGTYYWYAKSFDQAGNTSARSSVFSFILN
jgi:uncharacterized protein YegP (UPF0339 family)